MITNYKCITSIILVLFILHRIDGRVDEIIVFVLVVFALFQINLTVFERSTRDCCMI